MKCPKCAATLDKERGGGEKLLRTRGLVLKSSGMAAICPKCGSDVPFSPEMMQQLHQKAVLFFRNR